jgi:hypothetical protein
MWYTNWLLDTCYRCAKPKKLKTRLCGKSCPKGYKKTNIACGVIGSCKQKLGNLRFPYDPLPFKYGIIRKPVIVWVHKA